MQRWAKPCPAVALALGEAGAGVIVQSPSPRACSTRRRGLRISGLYRGSPRGREGSERMGAGEARQGTVTVRLEGGDRSILVRGFALGAAAGAANRSFGY